MSTPRVFDARQLRRLAEAAASARGPQGDPLFLVNEDDKLSLAHRKPGEAPPAGTVFEINTFARQPRRPQVTHASITSGDTTYHLETTYDAVFWSEAAVEKFVFSYYASESLWNAAHILSILSEAWYGYVPGAPTGGREAEDIPFALGHIPDSDYTPLNGEPGHDLHLLFRKKNGKKYSRSLAELIAEREGRSRETEGRAGQTPASPDGA